MQAVAGHGSASGVRLGARERDADRHGRAVADLARDVDGAVHHIDEVLDDGKAKAAAAHLTDARIDRACEFIEDMRQKFLFDADAVVADDNMQQNIIRGGGVGFEAFERDLTAHGVYFTAFESRLMQIC